MLFQKHENKNYKYNGIVEPQKMSAFFKAVLYNFDNKTNAKKYFEDICKYNFSNSDIERLFTDKKMNRHYVVKNNKLINELCKSYGYDTFVCGMRTVNKMYTDKLFEFEIKDNLERLIALFDKLENYPLIYASIDENKKQLVEIKGLTEEEQIYTDGEIMSDELDDVNNNTRKIIVSKPTFIIRKEIDELYRIRRPIQIFGYRPNVDQLPTIKDFVYNKLRKK